jgi:Flp pilus assembly protein TadG
MSKRLIRRRALRKFLNGAEAGSALVEMALTFPVLMAMILGAVQLGVMAHASIELTNATRAAAQYAGMNGGGYHDLTGLKAAAQSDAGELTITTATASSSCTCSNGSGACALDATTKVYSCATGKPVIVVTVTTTAGYPSLIKIPGLFSNNTFSLTSTAQQEVLP